MAKRRGKCKRFKFVTIKRGKGRGKRVKRCASYGKKR